MAEIITEKILVAYASTYGSTKEVAEAVAAILGERGIETDLIQMRKVGTLDGYCGVVLGAPLYMFHWHKDALQFLAQQRKALQMLPVAVFALGPFGDPSAEDWQEVRKQITSELAKFPWLSPVAVEVFGGKFDPTKLRFPLNLLPALRDQPASDIRDWGAIREWVNSLPEVFEQAIEELCTK